MGGVEKISAEHLARFACAYVRQSTPAQVHNNAESRERQYELKERAVALGWPAERVRVIDCDLGVSAGSGAIADREGFRELAGEVALGNVGLILGVEVSRLARDNSAWYQLLDVCALTGTLIADQDGIYDPADYSDQVALALRDQGLLLPRRRGQGRVEWAQATYSAVHDMLTNPTYAGSYAAFGRRQAQRRVGEDGRARVAPVPVPRERWRVLIHDHHEGYITWDQHEQILAQIARNAPTWGEGGPPREGRALLQGLVRCGRCGRKMHSAYSGARGREGFAQRYFCDPRIGRISRNGPDGHECQGLRRPPAG